jgi:hypothetical protein
MSIAKQPRTVALAAHYFERLAAYSSRAAVASREFCAPIVVDEREVVTRLNNINDIC